MQAKLKAGEIDVCIGMYSGHDHDMRRSVKMATT